LVNGTGIFEDRLGHLPLVVLENSEKATVATSVTGNPRLVPGLGNLQQQHIVVAINANFMHGLHMAGFFALEPQLAT
jgi:hypothetical protein